MPIRLKVITTGPAGAPYYNTFVFAGEDVTAATGARAALVAFYDGFTQYMSNNAVVDFNGVVEQFDLATGDTTGTITIASFTDQGAWGTGQAPGGTCLLLSYKTGVYVGGREIRGRSFISGLGDFGEGQPGVPSGVRTALQPVANNLVATGLSVYSPTYETSAEITSATLWSKFGLMRSRRD